MALQDCNSLRELCVYVWGEYDGEDGEETGADEQGAPAAGARKQPLADALTRRSEWF